MCCGVEMTRVVSDVLWCGDDQGSKLCVVVWRDDQGSK